MAGVRSLDLPEGFDWVMGSFWTVDGDGLQLTSVVGRPTYNDPQMVSSLFSGPISLGAGALILDCTLDRPHSSVCGCIVGMVDGHGRAQDIDILDMRMPIDEAATSVQMTFNPFADASPEVFTQLAVEMLSPEDPESHLWKGRVTFCVSALAKALCWMRDTGRLDITPLALRDYLTLKGLVALWDGSLCPDMPSEIRRGIGHYLCSIPGFQENKGANQAQTTLDKQGYLEMQFMRELRALIDDLGHIFLSTNPDLKMVDIVRDRRILVVRLPSESRPAETAGRLVMSAYQRAVDQFHPRVAA